MLHLNFTAFETSSCAKRLSDEAFHRKNETTLLKSNND